MNNRLAALLMTLLLIPVAALADARVSGVPNLRDLGGLPTARGHLLRGHVRDGVVFRSGALCSISEVDGSALKRMGIRTVIDFRVPEEIARNGQDRVALLGGEMKVVSIPLRSDTRSMAAYYRGLLEDRAQIRQFFRIMADPGTLPVLYHCASGTDRTGLMTALLLSALGTPRSAIVADYMKSARVSQVSAATLETALAEVDRAGGIEKFLASCGVTAGDLKRLRKNLVH
jgi:protein tyrosine/serine phosphatase